MTQDPLFLISVNLLIAFAARCWSRNLLTALLLAVIVIFSGGYLGSRHGTEVLAALNETRDWALAATRDHHAAPWPPELDQPFPDLELLDQDGNPTRLSEFRGRVVLLEPVAMSCPGCVAFSGGRRAGAFAGVTPQRDLEGIDDYLARFGQVDPNDPRIVVVQLILFNQELHAPTQDEVRRWADHFGFRRSANRVVLAGTEDLLGPASYALIPGFQLLDKDGVLRCDSTGHAPRHDLYRELLPRIRTLLD